MVKIQIHTTKRQYQYINDSNENKKIKFQKRTICGNQNRNIWKKIQNAANDFGKNSHIYYVDYKMILIKSFYSNTKLF